MTDKWTVDAVREAVSNINVLMKIERDRHQKVIDELACRKKDVCDHCPHSDKTFPANTETHCYICGACW